MHDVLAHVLQQRQRLREHRLVAAAHEGERGGIGAGDAARHRRIQHGEAALGRCSVHGAGAVDIDGGAVDQHRSAIGGGDDALVQEHGTDIGADG